MAGSGLGGDDMVVYVVACEISIAQRSLGPQPNTTKPKFSVPSHTRKVTSGFRDQNQAGQLEVRANAPMYSPSGTCRHAAEGLWVERLRTAVLGLLGLGDE